MLLAACQGQPSCSCLVTLAKESTAWAAACCLTLPCAAYSLPRTAAYPGLADQLQRIMLRGTMQQLKHEMSKPRGSIPHIMKWVCYGPEGTLSHAIKSERMRMRA